MRILASRSQGSAEYPAEVTSHGRNQEGQQDRGGTRLHAKAGRKEDSRTRAPAVDSRDGHPQEVSSCSLGVASPSRLEVPRSNLPSRFGGHFVASETIVKVRVTNTVFPHRLMMSSLPPFPRP